jgi:hypothetical protein
MPGNNIPELSVIIVNFNGLAWLPQCLSSLRQQTYQDFELIFVDNHSTDDSVAFVSQTYPEATIIQHAKNLGFAGGNNSGIRTAKGKYVILLNTDTRLTPTTFRDLLGAFKTIPRLGCVQPKLILMKDNTKLDSCGSAFTATGFLKHLGNQQSPNLPQWNKAFPVITVKGACMMFPRSILNQTGGLFDDNYFSYFEETDFCFRVWLAGYECWYYPFAQLYHAMGGVSGTYHLTNSFVQYHSYKNRLTTYLKNLSFFSLLHVLPICLISYLIIGFALLVGGQPWNTVAVGKAIIYQLAHLPTILKQRRYIQRFVRQRRDKDFLPPLTQKLSIPSMIKALYHHVTYEWLQRKLRSNPTVPSL